MAAMECTLYMLELKTGPKSWPKLANNFAVSLPLIQNQIKLDFACLTSYRGNNVVINQKKKVIIKGKNKIKEKRKKEKEALVIISGNCFRTLVPHSRDSLIPFFLLSTTSVY